MRWAQTWTTGVLAVLIALNPLSTAASPPINVDLQASFPSAPLIIELLETAADEDPEVYFPILDRIADGYFESSTSDEDLYNRFLNVLEEDKLMLDSESLSSFRLAFSVRSSAPRIEAHYQFYNTSILPVLGDRNCETWLELQGKQYCDPSTDKEDGKLSSAYVSKILPFDRVLNPGSGVLVTLYTDIVSKDFAKFHKIAGEAAKNGKSAYRIRYRPSARGVDTPLIMSGYGVELALKRTDYIVIDDRPKDDGNGGSESREKSANIEIDDEDVDDMKPLARSEVKDLALKASHYALSAENPLEALLKITKDFPKHSGTIAQHVASDEFTEEFFANRDISLPTGVNVMWINGAQYDPRKVDAFSLLDHLRKERKLISGFKNMGLSAGEAIKLLSNSALLEAYTKGQKEAQRYDWRDEKEGGEVVLWLNNIEKDKRYVDWPQDIQSLLQPMYGGQLPSVRRDIHNTIIPVDFSKPESAALVVQTLISLIKRKIPIRWGLVPSAISAEAEDQAKVVYHLYQTYGLTAVVHYLEESIAVKQKILLPHEPVFQKVLDGRSVKENMAALTVHEVLTDDNVQIRVNKATAYLKRLGAFRELPAIFVNGVPIKQDDEWLQNLSQRIGRDLQSIQRGVFEEVYTENTWVPGVFLENALVSRNPTVIPESDKDITLVNLQTLLNADAESVSVLPNLPISNSTDPWKSAQLIVIADLDSREGLTLLQNAILFREKRDDINLVIAHNGKGDRSISKSKAMFNYITTQPELEQMAISINRLKETDDSALGLPEDLPAFPTAPGLIHSLRLEPGHHGLLFNGRKIGPLSKETILSAEDIDMLYQYEDTRRMAPARKALEELDLTTALSDAPAAAQLYALIAVAQVSDVPEGIFERPPMVRTAMFHDWRDKHTSFTVGNNETATIQIVVTLDPASELAQRWVPVLKVLSELAGVSLKVYMNPKNLLEELPVKRFYRYVLNARPEFDHDGALTGGAATFENIPAKALLTLGMDVPPVWLVAAKKSLHDLDNIKLSSLGEGKRVDATYQLESILIEGHSRDPTSDVPPSGVQLVLSTLENPQIADTLIMANLGYFQFKTSPGYYHIDLKAGPSKKIFNLESVGSLGYEAQLGDLNTDVTLLNFQGVTLYPRLSRRPGMENEDVLEPSSDKTADFVQHGSKLVGSWLEKAGLGGGKAIQSASSQADINIFSVASGHLYERMLSIMMVSVMRHTKKTVKFWFIEQFLSPSFKLFVPELAKQYGFQHEMITYKWPHWLRAQKEKQREIWGYKMLFLDVLFPLDLDKVIFVDADQIVRTDMNALNQVDLKGAPYGFTPMCDSRTEMEGYRFWKQGYWKNHLRGRPYHISALYVVDLKRFRQIAAGDRLRQQYHQLSADPHSLSNLDQDLPNNMQMMIPIHSLDQSWLWCETWCSDESLKDAKTIDLCNNPETKEPKLERAQRQVPEWTEYDNEIAELARRTKQASRPEGSIQEDELNERKRASSSERAQSASSLSSSVKAEPSEKDEL